MMKLERTLSKESTGTARFADTPGRDTEESTLPASVSQVSRDILKRYSHTKRVGNYFLGKTLGEGSFAKVKEGLHLLTGEKVAVKCIDKKKAKEDFYVRKNMRREGKLLQLVRHSHVIKLYEIMETENTYYLVTELCQGGDLMDYICSKKCLDERETKRFIRQIISAVDYLHRAGILHRDLKVENLLLDENKDIKIIDFGLSNAVRVSHAPDGSTSEEFCVTQCGSPAYAAPELLGNKKYGHKVDIWSIGVNMFAMLTGNLPFTVEPFNIKSLHQKMLESKMNPLPDTLSDHGRDFIKKLLTADPEQRISLPEAMRHPWILDSDSKPMEPAPFPNKLCADQLDAAILSHMAQKLDFRLGDVIRLVTANVASSANATYQLFYNKLNRYHSQMRVRGNIPPPVTDLVSSSQSTQNTSGYASRDYVIDLLPLGNVVRNHGNTGNRIADEVAKSNDVNKTTERLRLSSKAEEREKANDVTLTDVGSQSTSRFDKKENGQNVNKIDMDSDTRPVTSLPKSVDNTAIGETSTGNRAISAWTSDNKTERKWSDRNSDRHKYATKQSELPVIAELPPPRDNVIASRDKEHSTSLRPPGRYSYRPRVGTTGKIAHSHDAAGHVTTPTSVAPSVGERKLHCWGNADAPEATTEPERDGATGNAAAANELRHTDNNTAVTSLRHSDVTEQRKLLRRRLTAGVGHADDVTKRNGRHLYVIPTTHAPLLTPLEGSSALSPGRRLVNFVYPAAGRATNQVARNGHVYRGRQSAATNCGSLNVTGSRTGVSRTRKADDLITPDGATSKHGGQPLGGDVRNKPRSGATPRYLTPSGGRKLTPTTSEGVSLPVIPPLVTPRGSH